LKGVSRGDLKFWKHLNTKSRIGKAVIVSFLVVMLIAFFLPGKFIYTPPELEIPVSVYGGTVIGTLPNVTYYMNVLLTTNGAFSVGNPVHVKVTLTQPSDPNFLNYYPCATITNAVNIPPIHGIGSHSATIFDDRINLTDYHNGSYIGSADIRFVQPGNQNISLTIPANRTNPANILIVPPAPVHIPGYPKALASETVVKISDASATLGIDSTRYIARITIIIGAFSVILLQPVLEAILLPPEPDCPKSKESAQSAPPQSPPKHSPPPTESPGRTRRWLRRHPQSQQE
jgi:hypothetical protein